jgi:hypothetical protein
MVVSKMSKRLTVLDDETTLNRIFDCHLIARRPAYRNGPQPEGHAAQKVPTVVSTPVG